MTLRTRIFILISLIILFILGVSLLIFVLTKKSATTPVGQNGAEVIIPAGTATEESATQPAVTTGATVPVQTSAEAIKNAAKQNAKIFIERYGSYSTENDYQNIYDVKALVTADLWSRLSSVIGKSTGEKFVGVTTQSIGASFQSYSANKAVVKVQTLREEKKDGVVTKTQKDVLVYEVFSNGNWLVEKFEWQ